MKERSVLTIDLNTVKPLGEIAYEALRDAIMTKLFVPGERLMETELADEMGISRTPVREAMRRLETDGYVVIVPRKGSYVAGISMKDVMDVFEIRTALEMLAAEKAAERATDEEIEDLRQAVSDMSDTADGDLLTTVDSDARFHSLIYQMSKNDRLVGLICDLREQIQRFRSTTLSDPGRLKLAVREHRKVLEAIVGRDPQKAAQTIQKHMEKAQKAIIGILRRLNS
ncbi:MAG: GntR family transcriptional regulator [Peptococcaceae bacterium]|nr:GntR family transcriptional regulator [Peptococcaceae bacterium]